MLQLVTVMVPVWLASQSKPPPKPSVAKVPVLCPNRISRLLKLVSNALLKLGFTEKGFSVIPVPPAPAQVEPTAVPGFTVHACTIVVGLPLPSTAPTMLTLSVMLSSPAVSSCLSVAGSAMVSVYVPAGTIMVSAPAAAFASNIACRKLHCPGGADAHGVAPVLMMSLVVLTLKVGSGSGISMEGAISP